MSVNTIFYNVHGEVGRASHQIGDLVAMPEGATHSRTFPIDVTLPPSLVSEDDAASA